MADKTIPALKILRGKVGINIATPTQQLHVNGEALISTGSTSVRTLSGIFKADTIENSAGASNLKLQTEAGGNKHIEITPNGTGNVGIGTNAPDSLLMVYKSSADSIVHVRGANSGADARVRINGYNSSELYIDRNGSGRFALRRTTGTDDLSLLALNSDYTDNSTIMFWDYSHGSVGIGTVSPVSMLHVAGNAEIGDTTQQTTVLTIRAENTAGAPAATTQIRMKGYEGRGIGTFYEDSSYSGQEWFCGMNYSAAFGTWNVGYDASGGQAEYNANTLFRVRYTGRVEMLNYGSGNFTGTAAYKLAVDSSGNIIETAVGAGQVDGSGTTNYIARWSDTDTIGNSNIFDNGTIGIGTAANLNGKVTIREAGNSGTPNHIFCMLSSAAVGHGAAIFLKTSTSNTNNRYGARIRAIRNDNNNAAADLAFSLENTGATAVAEVVRFTSDGSVGIGTTAPGQKLHVNGNAEIDGSIYINDTNTRLHEGSGNSLRVTTNSGYIEVGSQNSSWAHFYTDRGRYYFNKEIVVDTGIIRSYNDDLQLDAGYDGAVAKNIIFRTGNAEKMRMDTAGSFGIGTNAPANTLHVQKDVDDFIVKLENDGNSTSSDGLWLDTRWNTASNTVLKVTSNSGSADYFYIKGDGNVGIGTASPNQKLTVAGGKFDTVTAMGTAGQWSSSQIRLETTNAVDTTGWQGISFDTSTTNNYGWSIGVNRSSSGRGSFRFYEHVNSTTGTERFTIEQDGNVGIGTNNPSCLLQLGTDGVQGGASLAIRRNGDSINFGHVNGAGYGSVIGCSSNNGQPHIGFMCEAGTNINTFRTRGLKGNVIYANTSGTLYFAQVANSNADNQSLTDRVAIESDGDAYFFGGNWFCNTNNSTNVTNGGLYINRGGGLYAYALATARSGAGLSGVDFWDYHGVGLVFGPDSSTKVLTVKSNIGIGTTNPQSTLAVNGEASFGDGSRLSLIGLNIASSSASPNIKIRTKIPFALGGADFTVNLKGFIYGSAETANLTVCWHYYNNTFYNATCSSSGGWAPTIQLSAEDWDSSGTKKVCICLSTPGYWVKMYVESMFSNNYANSYVDGWTWVDAVASGTGNDLASLSYRSDFGNNFRMLSNGCVGIGGGVLTNAQLTVNGGVAIGDNTYGSNMNSGTADLSVDCNGTPQISWLSNYLQIGGTNQNWNMRMSTSLLQTYSSNLTITAGGTGTAYKLYLGTNGQTQTITCNNGSVGIGTASPSRKLHVFQTADGNNHEGAIQVGGTSSAVGAFLGYNSTSSGIVNLTSLNNSGGANAKINFGFGAATDGTPDTTVMTLLQSGSVGIGTASPSAKLHIRSTGLADISRNSLLLLDGKFAATGVDSSDEVGIAFRVENSGSGAQQTTSITSSYQPSYNSLNLQPAGGNVGIGTNNPGHQLHLYGASAEFEIQRTGSYADTINFGVPSGVPTIVGGTDLALGGNGTWTEHVRIKSNGNVGIGTAAPTNRLDIRSVQSAGDSNGSNLASITLETYNSNSPHHGSYVRCKNYVGGGGGPDWKIGGIEGYWTTNKVASIDFMTGDDWFNPGNKDEGEIAFTVYNNTGSGSTAIEAMRIHQTGNIGIGSTNPGNRLLVKHAVDITPTSGGAGQFAVVGNGYTTFLAMNATAAYFGHNSSARSLSLMTNETERLTISGGGAVSVAGSFSASSKSFLIDHPTKENKKLEYGCLEGPEFGVYHRGRVQSNTITLPDYWTALVREGTITVQLTPKGSFQHLYVVSQSLTEIIIGAADGETIDCFYTIYGERADIDSLVVEKDV